MGWIRGTRTAVATAVGIIAAAMIPAAGFGAVAPVPGVVYAGETPQFEVVTAEVTPARNRVAKFIFAWSAQCVLGPAATPTTDTATSWTEYRGNFPINAAGRWSKNFTASGVDGTIQQLFNYRLSGVRTATKMTGTIHVILTERDAAGEVVRSCDSKPVRYTAFEKGGFGGLTVGQRNPTLVRLNPAGTRIQRIRWDWAGTCIAGPAAKPETQTTWFQRDFVDGPIVIKSNGAFAKSFKYQPIVNQATGLSDTYSARVLGRRVGRTIRGTLTAGVVETETATGAVVRTCTSGPIKYTTKD